MTPLFSEAGHHALNEFLTKPVLCLFDFDGTLAPLSGDPQTVSLPWPVQQRLQALQRYAPVGILTGRSLADLRQRLKFEPDYVVGNHGLEGLPGWQAQAPLNFALCRAWLAALSGLRSSVGDRVWMEDKAYSLTVHYRHAPDPRAVERLLLERFARLVPSPRVIAGKFNVSLLPPDAGDKGRAVQQLLTLSNRSGALYVGDDQTDEDVFKRRDAAIFSVRVGEAISTDADYQIQDHQAMEPLLDLLLTLLPGQRQKGFMYSGMRQ